MSDLIELISLKVMNSLIKIYLPLRELNFVNISN
jgi:hypothetical protein